LVATAASPVLRYLEGLHGRYAALETGALASYIPELAHRDPDDFGIAVAMLDGALYEVGDSRTPFTIQSMSKPLTYGLALDVHGDEDVHRRVGVEPSGDPFNEISLTPGTGTPVNPMINAGAIACAGMVAAAFDEPFAALLATYSRFAGRTLSLDAGVHRSESETGHRNRAIAHLLAGAGILDVPAETAVDLYFRQCSIAVDCRDLATIAATLANGGVNPTTGVRAVSERVVRRVLSVMATCGMYDGAGDWLVSVGLPAKSGVSGGVLAVLPGRLGIGVYSPLVDERGNSVRGVAVCKSLSHDLALHLVRPGERTAPPLRAAVDLSAMSSRRLRPGGQRRAIERAAGSTAVFEVQGELGFVAAEAIARRLDEAELRSELVVIDIHRVSRVDRGGLEFLRAIAESLRGIDGVLAVSGAPPEVEAALGDSALTFADFDSALEWAEDELLRRLGEPDPADSIALEDHAFLAHIELAPLELERLTLPAGATVVRAGDAAAELFLVTRGTLTASIDGRRLTTLPAGAAFGELGYFERGTRAADVRADSDVECYVLSYATLDRLAETMPDIHAVLVRRLAAVLASSLHAANTENTWLRGSASDKSLHVASRIT
jgi:glutaminase